MNHLQYEFGLVPVKIVKEDKAEYIQALIDAREQDSLEPFREFMMEEHIRNISKEIEALPPERCRKLLVADYKGMAECLADGADGVANERSGTQGEGVRKLGRCLFCDRRKVFRDGCQWRLDGTSGYVAAATDSRPSR
jgi:hypothetical protein